MKGGNMKNWKKFNDECGSCGGVDIRVLTAYEADGGAYDGDIAECLECGATGMIYIDHIIWECE